MFLREKLEKPNRNSKRGAHRRHIGESLMFLIVNTSQIYIDLYFSEKGRSIFRGFCIITKPRSEPRKNLTNNERD